MTGAVGTERFTRFIAFVKLTVIVESVGLFKAMCHTGPVEIAVGDECEVVSTRVTWMKSSGCDAVTGWPKLQLTAARPV